MPRRAPSRSIGQRAAALAAEDAGALTSALALAPSDPRGIHEARKAVRRLRSLLALARAALGKDAVDAIDRPLRALARGLSDLRDGQVVQDTAHALAREAEHGDEAANWEAIRRLLADAQRERTLRALQADPGFVRRQAQAHRHAEQLRLLPWDRLRGQHLRHALDKSVRRQQRAQATALASGRMDDLHAWRRKSRRLRMQLNALKHLHVSPRRHAQHPTSRHMAALVDQLGTLQDLGLLHRALRRLERGQDPPAPRARRRDARLRADLPIQPLA